MVFVAGGGSCAVAPEGRADGGLGRDGFGLGGDCGAHADDTVLAAFALVFVAVVVAAIGGTFTFLGYLLRSACVVLGFLFFVVFVIFLADVAVTGVNR